MQHDPESGQPEGAFDSLDVASQMLG
jgi:hypothetical protein